MTFTLVPKFGLLLARIKVCRKSIAVAAVLLILVLGHGVILRKLIWPIVDNSATIDNEGRAGGVLPDADYFCLHGSEQSADGFKAIERAAAWYAESSGRKILLVLPRSRRIVEIGAAPSFEETTRRQLAARGVAEDAVLSIHAEARDFWDEAHAMSDWLAADPKGTVAWACSPFTSGRMRHVLNKVLDADAASRVSLVIFADPACPPRNWWRSRNGIKEFMFAWLSMIYVWTEGERRSVATPQRVAEFQSEVRAAIGEAPL